MQISLGKIVVTTPGSPIRLTHNQPDPTKPLYVHAYTVKRLKGNTGDLYISLSATDDRTDLNHILTTLDSKTPAFSAGISLEVNGTNLAEIYVDADQSNDGLIGAALVM